MKSRIALIFILFGCLSSCGREPVPTLTSVLKTPSSIPTTALIPTQTAMATVTSTATLTATPTSSPTPTETPGPPTLRGFAEKNHLLVGTYLTGAWFPDLAWREIVAREFNMAVVSYGFYWDLVEASPGRFDFSSPDEQVTWALSHDMQITGHALLLARPPYIPNWLAYGNFSKEELAEYLRNYIVQVMSHYTGQIGMYIVVEDAPLPSEMRQDVFYQAFGYEYIDLAFEIARQADPSALLIYNADDHESADSLTAPLTHEIVARLKSKGLIDGIGFEFHLEASQVPSKAEIIAQMRSYGLPVHVTEIDVDLSGLGGTQEERYAEQARIFGDVLSACLESGACASFSVWGIGDKHSWLERESKRADPTLFDDDLNPKPAYFTLLQILQAWQSVD